MKITEQGIALKGVRRVVTGRRKAGNRVQYLLPDGRFGVVERVFLLRSRGAGYRAFRVPPYVWRLLPEACDAEWLVPFRGHAAAADRPTIERLRRRKALIGALLGGMSRRRLTALIERHQSPEIDPARPGVPDLVAFRKGPVGRSRLRFIEVKRMREALKPHQRKEIAFMRSIGIRAGVLRSIELS